MPNSDPQQENDEYSIKVTESAPQVIDGKKSFFLLDKDFAAHKSPKRDSMIGSHKNIPIFSLANSTSNAYNNQEGASPKHKNNCNSSNNVTISVPSSSLKLNQDKWDNVKDRIDQKITENIKKREGFESLFDDPEINKYIK